MNKFYSMVGCIAMMTLLYTISWAQTVFTEGVITYKLSMNGSQANEPMAAGMMENMKMSQSVKGDKSRVDMDFGMGSQSTIVDGKQKTEVMLMNWGGQKFAVKMSEEEQKKHEVKQPDYEIEYVDETKEIAGYKCKKAIVKFVTGEIFTVYYTTELSLKYKDFSACQYEKIKGVPLEWEQQGNDGNSKFVCTVSKIEQKKIDDSIFDIPADYQQMTAEEFGKMMGGFMPQE